MAMIEFDKLLFDETTGKWSAVSSTTGEIKEINFSSSKVVSTTSKKTSKKVVDNDPIAKITLEEGKYSFNSAAIELMSLEPEQKIAIKYETYNKIATPVIGTDEAFGTHTGNRLTKSFTVSCRGANREKLEEFGTVFEIEKHPTRDGLFILKGDKMPEAAEEDEAVELPDDLPFDLNVVEGADDADLDEILSSDLTL